jgi:DNA-binding transcriptional LysR family regulator
MNLRSFDLNLLVIVEAVLAELSVTRAAKRLNLSQPAVSQAMARARDVFGDDLIIREGTQMLLTPLARRLVPQLKEFCSKAEALVAPVFEPRSANLDFSVCANDLTELIILPSIISEVARLAPGCRIFVKAPEPFLVNASIDLAIIGAPVPEGPFVTRVLYEEHFVVIARPGHPGMREGITAEEFAGLAHALVSPTGQGLIGPIDTALERIGLSRRIALSVSRFTTLPHIIASSDLIASVPARFAARDEVQRLCNVWPMPFESPRFTMKMVWHQMHDSDPAHLWLRSLF